jgi:hypothetical protein
MTHVSTKEATTMSEHIGGYPQDTELRDDIVLTIPAESFPVRWALCSVTADFIGMFCAEHLDDRRDQDTAHLVFVANELIENAVKFNHGDDVTVRGAIEAGEAVFIVSNAVSAEGLPALRQRFLELCDEDPSVLLIQQIEANAEQGDSSNSRLGLLTLINDYGARLGWRIERRAPGSYRLHSMARVPLEERR